MPIPEMNNITGVAPDVTGTDTTTQDPLVSKMGDIRKVQSELDKTRADLGKLDATSAGYYLDKVKKAQEAYQEATKNIQTAEMAQGLIQAGAQIAASLYGLKNNLAIGKLDFAKSNFGQQYENAMEVLRQARERGKIEAEEQVMGQEGELKAQEKSLSDKIKDLEKEEGRLYQEKQTADYRTWIEKERVKADDRGKKEEKEETRRADIRDLTAKKSDIQKEYTALQNIGVKELPKLQTRLESKSKDIKEEAFIELQNKAAEYGLPSFSEVEEPMSFIDQLKYSKSDYIKETMPAIKRKIALDLKNKQKEISGITSQIEERVAGKTSVVEDKKPNEVKRKTKDGKTAVFNGDTKEFLRYE
jgi:hypothetical protein